MRKNKPLRCSVCRINVLPEDKIIINSVYLGAIHHEECAQDLPEQMIFDRGTYGYLLTKHVDFFEIIRNL